MQAVTCDYCRQEIILSPARRQALQAAGGGSRIVPPRAARAGLGQPDEVPMAVVILSLGLIGLSFIFLMALIVGYSHRLNIYTMLTEGGKPTQATITRLFYTFERRNEQRNYYAEYKYEVVVDGKPRLIETYCSILPEQYFHLREGEVIDIVYASAIPSINSFYEGMEPPSLPTFVGLGVLAVGLLVAGLVLLLASLPGAKPQPAKAG